jgi:hypothetical protein
VANVATTPDIPALATTISTLPNNRLASANRRSTSLALLTSACTAAAESALIPLIASTTAYSSFIMVLFIN